jgi:hypothetical protein
MLPASGGNCRDRFPGTVGERLFGYRLIQHYFFYPGFSREIIGGERVISMG